MAVLLFVLTGQIGLAQDKAHADPSTLLLAGERVVELVDQGLASDLWQYVSASVKSTGTASEEEFIRGIYSVRRPLGMVIGRNWVNISQINFSGSETTPAGRYVTVSFLTDFASKPGLQEHVTFLLDEDGIWRITGYSLK